MSTRLYLYAIVTGTEPFDGGLTGLAGGTVSLLGHRDLAAAASVVVSAEVRPEPEQLLCHERVVETLMAQRSTLPVRFGTVLSDADAVVASLAERYATLAADLQRLAGQVEMGVRILWDAEAVRRGLPAAQPLDLSEPPAQDAGSNGERPGTRYLLARSREIALERQFREAAQALEDWCLSRLGPLTGDSATRLLSTAAMPVSAAFLLPRADMTALVAAAAQMQRERPDLDIVCTGPWPPYHFVSR